MAVMAALLMGKEAETALAGTVIEAGTVSAAAVSVRVTDIPPAGAALESVTIQKVLAFCARLAAAHLREDARMGGTRATDAWTDEPFRVALRVTV